MKSIIGLGSALGIALVHIAAADAQTGRTVPFQVVDQRGLPLANAVVMVYPSSGFAGRPLSSPPRLAMAQRSRAFIPGTLVVARGATVAFPNLDDVRHSIYSFSPAARFEIDLYGQNQSRSQRFEIAGTVSIGCNIHDDMRGYVKVVDTPFALRTDLNGFARIDGLPVGPLSIKVWHPQMQARDQEQSFTATPGSNGTRLIVTIRGASR